MADQSKHERQNGRQGATPGASGSPAKSAKSAKGAGYNLWEVLATPIAKGDTQYWRCEYILEDHEGRTGPASATVIRREGALVVRLVTLGEVAVTDEISSPLDIAYFLGLDRPTQQKWYRAEPDGE